MRCWFCKSSSGHSNAWATLSRGAAKSFSAKLRTFGLLGKSADASARLAVCARCPLATIDQGTVHCGKPLLRQIIRDPATQGCGCPIADKAADPAEHCPITPRHLASSRTTDQADSPNSCNCKWCTAARATEPNTQPSAA